MTEALTCTVCPHECRIREGGTGLCGARGIQDGRVVSLNYGQAASLSLDPIEKKPLARFRPGKLVLSYGSFGCNTACAFCQNADISQVRACGQPRTTFVTPEQVVSKAVQLASEGNIGLAITYNEPLISPEFLMDCGRMLQDAGLDLVLVTNGYANASVFDEACTVTSAMNVDLKCFNDDGYRSMGAPGGFEVVRRNILAAHDAGVHVEVTTLVVPGISDSEEDMEQEAEWLASILPDIPLHITRFFPCYKMQDANATDVELIHRLRAIAAARLRHVYLGNVR